MTMAVSLKDALRVKGHGILGRNSKGQQSHPPDRNTIVVDPAGLGFIRGDAGGPSGAKGAAEANYVWLGISKDQSFPDEVKSGITEPCQAKYYVYADGNKKCIHVVGPDFREKLDDVRDYTMDEAVKKLAVAYGNVFEEFCKVGMKENLTSLRLLPISGGIFSGPFKEDLPEMTAQAVLAAYEKLAEDRKQHIMKSSIEMCIFMESEFDLFACAFEKLLPDSTAEDSMGAMMLSTTIGENPLRQLWGHIHKFLGSFLSPRKEEFHSFFPAVSYSDLKVKDVKDVKASKASGFESHSGERDDMSPAFGQEDSTAGESMGDSETASAGVKEVEDMEALESVTSESKMSKPLYAAPKSVSQGSHAQCAQAPRVIVSVTRRTMLPVAKSVLPSHAPQLYAQAGPAGPLCTIGRPAVRFSGAPGHGSTKTLPYSKTTAHSAA